MSGSDSGEGKNSLGRRGFLLISLGAAVGISLAAGPVQANIRGTRRLSLYNPHQMEALSVDYCIDSWYVPDALQRINQFMRDPRTDESVEIDPHLLDVLYQLQQRAGSSEPLNIVSGYRSAATNASMARRSRGVARNSYHMYGRAADLHLPGYSLAGLRDIALSLEAGGVGYYPHSDFIHVDTGPVRNWGGEGPSLFVGRPRTSVGIPSYGGGRATLPRSRTISRRMSGIVYRRRR